MRGSVEAIPRNSYFSHQVRGWRLPKCTSLRHDHDGLRSPRRSVTETRRQELWIGDMAAIPQRMPESPPVDGNKPVVGREVDVEGLCRALTIHSAPRLHRMATAHLSDRTAAHSGSLRRDRRALGSGIVPWPTSQGPRFRGGSIKMDQSPSAKPVPVAPSAPGLEIPLLLPKERRPIE